jgi:hypothetical protein
LYDALLSIPSGDTSSETFTAEIAHHPVFLSLLKSLMLDYGDQLFTIELRLLLAILPYAPKTLTAHVPLIMVSLGRAVYWQARPFASARTTSEPNASLRWSVATNAMENPVDIPPSLAPDRIVKLLVTAIYNAWPSNLLAFLRDPVAYLKGKQVESIYNAPWEDVWEAGALARRAGPLLRDFHLHPSLLNFSSTAELADLDRWTKTDPSSFVTRANMLAHSELAAGDRLDFFESEDARPLHMERSIELFRLEARFADRIRRLYLHRECPQLPS